jgi:hypothetical protein
LIERSIGRPAAEHVGIGMIDAKAPGSWITGEHGRCDRGYQKRGGSVGIDLVIGEILFVMKSSHQLGIAAQKRIAVRWFHAMKAVLKIPDGVNARKSCSNQRNIHLQMKRSTQHFRCCAAAP